MVGQLSLKSTLLHDPLSRVWANVVKSAKLSEPVVFMTMVIFSTASPRRSRNLCASELRELREAIILIFKAYV